MYTIAYNRMQLYLAGYTNMNSKTVPLSVRISHEDAEFLAGLKIEGANTPSDKLRALISERKVQTFQDMEFGQVYSQVSKIMNPAILHVREVMHNERQSSEIIRMITEWLPDILTLYLAKSSNIEGRTDLEDFESELLDIIFRMIEGVMRLGITDNAPCITSDAISKRLKENTQMLRIILDKCESKGA